MFQRTPKSTRVAEPEVRADFDSASLHVEHIQAWRDAAKDVRNSYRAYCTAGRRDSHRLYVVFLDALRYEELAARRLERDATALEAADPAS